MSIVKLNMMRNYFGDKNLLINSKPGDLLVFGYSGHGSNISDKNNDETDGRDELIIPLDLKQIVDDELKQLIQTYLKKDVTLFALFDSCFSGTMLDLKYQFIDSLNFSRYKFNALLTCSGFFELKSGDDDKVFNLLKVSSITLSLGNISFLGCGNNID